MVNGSDNRIGFILAEGRSSLWGGSQRVPTALLPICGKSLLAQRIDEFRDLGLRRICILTDEKRSIEAARINLNAFSMSLEVTTHADMTSDETDYAFITSAEIFCEPIFSVIQEVPKHTVMYSRNGTPIAASVEDSAVQQAISAMRGQAHGLNRLQSTVTSISLDSIDAFINTNLDVLSGSLSIPRISGLSVAPNVYLEWVLSAKPANIKNTAHIGDGAVLHRTARIKDCVIGRQATVLPYAKLERCVVLAGATVPENAQYSNAIVSNGLTVFANESDGNREIERFALESAIR